MQNFEARKKIGKFLSAASGKNEPVRFILCVFGYAIIFGIFFRWNGIHIQMFRAESGVFLTAAWNGNLQFFVHDFIFKPYNGHFTPIQFTAEFIQSRLIGVNERIWFARQMLVVGLLATILTKLFSSLIELSTPSSSSSKITAVALTTLFLVQPAMMEMVSWPFMSAQLFCITCGACGLFKLLQFCKTQKFSAAAASAAFGYASMHFLGVGIIFSLGTLFTLGLIAWVDSAKKNVWITIFALGLLTCAHTFVMMQGSTQPIAQEVPIQTSILRIGALFIGLIYRGAQSLWATGYYPWPSVSAYVNDAFYGLTLILTLAVTILSLFTQFLRGSRTDSIIPFALCFFTSTSLILFCMLPVVRSRDIADPHIIDAYLFGTRYLIFASFFILLPTAFFAGKIVRYLRYYPALPAIVMLIGAVAASHNFARHSIPELWPKLDVSAKKSWNTVVLQVRDEMANQGYVLDRPAPELDPEFTPPLSSYRRLLEHELHCVDCVEFGPKN